jgi:hypothetical protein
LPVATPEPDSVDTAAVAVLVGPNATRAAIYPYFCGGAAIETELINLIVRYRTPACSGTDSAFGFLQTNNPTTLIGDVELISTSGGAHNLGGVILCGAYLRY